MIFSWSPHLFGHLSKREMLLKGNVEKPDEKMTSLFLSRRYVFTD